MVTYYQWQYETTSYEKDGKMKTVRKPVKKEIKVQIRKLVQQVEETLPLVFQHVATITHQYQLIAELKRKLTQNEVLIHIDFSENYSYKYNEEIQAVHFGGARQQITLHTGVLYFRDNDVMFYERKLFALFLRTTDMILWRYGHTWYQFLNG